MLDGSADFAAKVAGIGVVRRGGTPTPTVIMFWVVRAGRAVDRVVGDGVVGSRGGGRGDRGRTGRALRSGRIFATAEVRRGTGF